MCANHGIPVESELESGMFAFCETKIKFEVAGIWPAKPAPVVRNVVRANPDNPARGAKMINARFGMIPPHIPPADRETFERKP